MEILGNGPLGPGAGVAAADKTARVTSWSQFGEGSPHVAVLSEMYVDGASVVLQEGRLGFYPHVDDGVLAGASGGPIR